MAILKIKQPNGSWAIVGDTSETIKFTEQQLTEEQKKVARENIDSASKNTVDILEGRIETIEEVIPEAVTKTAENQTINGNITITGNLIV